MPTTLADLTTLRLGGPAKHVVTATSSEQIVSALCRADELGKPSLVVGGGSNLVVSDTGWPGVVVLIRTEGIASTRVGDLVTVTVQAGEVWDTVVATSVRNGWSGLAAMSGIPGRTGATPIQNVGAYGSEVADVISSLSVYDRETREVSSWSPAQCGFGFRTSAFKHTDRYVVLSVTFSLTVSPLAPPVRYAEVARRLGIEVGEVAPSADVRDTVLELRRSKGMLLDADDHDTWSVGSFFVNPFVAPDAVPDGCPHWTVDGQVKLSAAWLIENAGFTKGYGTKKVAVSSKHTLALTNRGGASTAQLLDLAREIRAGVEARFGVRLRPEARLAGVEL
ncbi:UDP-N-acetylmuramate dehydrogenase [Jatrophihabitans sp.]|uniref:UDP-N-acetylmuramate dehydrogenase n=1 Tax=Jatrophihabitans sp. TaxID=1932789 RepID=UPI0030C74049|nr:UDP-N-acetylmuramate dehydrogenase [Jatrophihabitans sp.]